MAPRESNARGSSFTNEEDVALCNAWITNTTDEVTGSWQTHGDMWTKVCSTYYTIQIAQHWEPRTDKSLECRWKKIQKSVNLWRGMLSRANAANVSGQNDADVVKVAKQLYQNRANQKMFKLEHCWEILKYHPKWSLQQSRYFEEEANNNSRTPFSCAQTQRANLGDDVDGTPRGHQGGESSRGRPDGRNTVAKSRRNSFAEPLLKEMVDNSRYTRELMEKQRLENQEFLQRRDARSIEKLEIERERNNQAKRAADRIVMTTNTADMTPLSKQYWTDQKKEILNSQVQRATARNLFSGTTYEEGSSQAYEFPVSHSNIPPAVNEHHTYGYSDIHRFDLNDDGINYNNSDEVYTE